VDTNGFSEIRLKRDLNNADPECIKPGVAQPLRIWVSPADFDNRALFSSIEVLHQVRVAHSDSTT
jgi:hypothetical protein